MFKIINAKGSLTKTARDAFQKASIAGGANEMIVFPRAYVDSHKFKRISAMMKSINIAWYEFDGNIYIYRKWVYEAVSDRSEAALAELKNIIG